MKVIIAPQAFKGSLDAKSVAENIEMGIRDANPELQTVCIPVADGGDGTLDVLVKFNDGQTYTEEVIGPTGSPVLAEWGVIDNNTAVIEMALASGLSICTDKYFDLRETTTFGTGQLIRAAVEKGYKTIIIGLGGSATNDGGIGAIQALGVKFLDIHNKELSYGGAELKKLSHININNLNPSLKEIKIIIASDVTNPLYGPTGASYVFGPQKGGTTAILDELEESLKHFSSVITQQMGINYSNYSGAGAAGGLAYGLMSFTQATIKSGFDVICEKLDFDEKIKDADLIITGEGRTDASTLYNKAPVAIANKAKQYNIPVICISGSIGTGYEQILNHGISKIITLENHANSIEDSIQNTAIYLRKTAKEFIETTIN
ncbi:MAG: glycerate kinase [Dehalococcoidia bacterium]